MERKTVLGGMWDRQQQPESDGDTRVRGESPDAPEPPPDDSQHPHSAEIEAAARARRLHYVQNATDARGESAAAPRLAGDDASFLTRTRDESVRGDYEMRVRGESAG